MKEKNLYYEKVKKYYWSIYEVKSNGDWRNLDGFESLEELQQWINNNIGEISKDNLYNYISHQITLKDKYIIVKDKLTTFEELDAEEV